MKLFQNRKCVFLCLGFICSALYIYDSNMESRSADVSAHLFRLGHFLGFAFPNGLPEGMSFIEALHESSDNLGLGPIDPNGNNPLPDFLPQADYHYEKKHIIGSAQSPRVVCWVSIRRLTGKHYFALFSNWKEEYIWDSSKLPEFELTR